MKLLLDIGNSSIKSALYQNSGVMHFQKQDYGQNLDSVLEKIKMSLSHVKLQIKEIWVSCVNQNIRHPVQCWAKKNWDIVANFTSTKKMFAGIENGYQKPETLGVDRWLAMLAAWKHTASANACYVVDCGTATTIDAIDSHGKHLGGAILPSGSMMMHALGSILHNIDPEQYISPNQEWTFGCSTIESMKTGCWIGQAGLINTLHHKLLNIVNGEVDCYITGGYAEIIAPMLDFSPKNSPYLVLEGLSIVAGTCSE